MFYTVPMSTPDQILSARLNGSAQRLARAGGPIHDAVVELQELADGRADLLAEECGLMVGSWSAQPSSGDYLVAAGLLMLAGADQGLVGQWIEVGRERAMASRRDPSV